MSKHVFFIIMSNLQPGSLINKEKLRDSRNITKNDKQDSRNITKNDNQFNYPIQGIDDSSYLSLKMNAACAKMYLHKITT